MGRRPSLVDLCVSVYRVLIHLYPHSFRRRFGTEMVAVFREMLRDAEWANGRFGLMRVCLRLIPDLIITLAVEHWLKACEYLTRWTFGNVRPHLKPLLASAFVALMLAVPVRLAVATPYRAVDNSLEPAIPQGSYVIVFKLARQFDPGDLVVYSIGARNFAGRVVSFDETADELLISRNLDAGSALSSETQIVSTDQVVGLVVLNAP